MTWRDNVVAEAKTWMLTPHVNAARIKGAGVDCGTLLLEVFEHCGLIPHTDVGWYPADFHLHQSEEKYLSFVNMFCDQTEPPFLPGDVAVFKFGRCVSHAGIVVEWPTIIHAYIGVGVIMSSVNESLLLYNNGESRMAGVYRLRGQE
ncbi:MAG: hypothetical protein H6Q72_4356 [Firmicutes bacterium]|nr:hypothetical protein [Bacillota bacterium]